MTTPMMTIESVQKAQRLIRERNRIAAAKWNAITDDPNLRERSGSFGGMAMRATEPADEQLALAIEEFRARKLDAINAQLRELGVDPTEQNSAA
jgi:3-methyladenine DNA glycosylase Tag